jgi:copper(I)-binding protein
VTAPAATKAAPAQDQPAGRGRTWLTDLVRSAAGPVIAAAALIGLLSAYVGLAGGASRIKVQVTSAAIPMISAPGQQSVNAYLTIRNLTASPIDLVRASTPAAATTKLTRPAGASQSTRASLAELTIPPHATITLTPFGPDLTLTGTARLHDGQQVPLTLTFRGLGTVTAHAAVTAPGSP